MHGLMAPPGRSASAPLMQAAGAPPHPRRGVMSYDPAALPSFDFHSEVRRLLWCAAGVLALVLAAVGTTGQA